MSFGPWLAPTIVDFELQHGLYGTGVDTETHAFGRGRVPGFLWVLAAFGCFPLVSGRVFSPPGSILGSAFLWRCFWRQKPPCVGRRGGAGTLVRSGEARIESPEAGPGRAGPGPITITMRLFVTYLGPIEDLRMISR